MSEQNKKVLIFSIAYHPFVGGAEVAIKEITDRIGDVDFDMITVNLDGKQKQEEKIGNVNIYRVGSGKLSKYFFPWLAMKKARELNKKNKYSLIWAMMANSAGWAAMRFKNKNPQIKYLLTLQEGDSEWDIWWRTCLIRLIYKSIYRRADFIQPISQFLANRAKKMGYVGDFKVVPNGISMKHLVNYKRDRVEDKMILTASRLVKKNGIEHLIRSMVSVNGQLVILGDGVLKNQLRRLVADLGLNDKVNFIGHVSNREVYQYLSRAAVFVRPSLSEGLGNAFLEAMAMRVPTIGTAVGGIVDFLQDGRTGWVCQIKNPRSIAEKINYVLDPVNKAEVNRVVDRAEELVKKKYTWAIVAKKMKNIFNRL